MTKQCTQCKQLLDESSFNKGTARCKACRKAYNQEHREEINAYHKVYNQTNEEKIRAYYQAHREEKKAYQKTYRQKNYHRKIWYSMIERCNNPKCKSFKNYGGRGITVCQRWLDSFEDFKEDMGERPTPQHTIDRIDNEGNYEP
ncbi:hypothetical protein LCGC14_1872280 [marine sediment metagenome]|uniref:Phage protein n=1 Tax=marine sediment metagenome TaxID=412755 RepID=A0A0F9J3D3_9ZZZZ